MFHCNYCGRGFETLENLALHQSDPKMGLHKDKGYYEAHSCAACGKTFANKRKLSDHLRSPKCKTRRSTEEILRQRKQEKDSGRIVVNYIPAPISEPSTIILKKEEPNEMKESFKDR